MLRRLVIAILAVWGCSAALPASAEPIFPPGVRVGLEPVGNLVASKRFPGFEDPDRKVAVSILDLPAAAYPELESSAFKDQPGIEGVKRESFAFGSGIGFLFTGRGTQDGVTVHKWLLLANAVGGPVRDLAMLINVQVPETARGAYTDELIRKMLASVTFRAAPIEEQVGMLPFKLSDLAGFRVVQVLPAGGVILTDGPTDDINKQPYMIVAVGRGGPANAGERGRFANDLLLSAPLRELSLQLSEPMRIHGLPGHEIRARAKGPNEDPVALVQWVRFGGGGYLRIVGAGPKDQWDALFPRFRAVRDGIDIK